MNRTALKNYAPQARRDFIQAMTDRAAYYGLKDGHVADAMPKGDVVIIDGREHSKAIIPKRGALVKRILSQGFSQTMEALAYTWFNRLVAIRFMELHGYLDHGYRVLSHPEAKPTPEILEHAEHIELPGLDRNKVIDLKLAGNKEGELYRLLLVAQCNALFAAMPFLFERVEDETELLLPDNLLHSDSLIRKLVNEIDEADWQEVEIIGWLYQFYISERKDEVIGKVVASEDIPAATQLFTPNWIVKYLVQNTLGRQWLATYPQSALRQQMEYYIEPAEQTPEVQEQLKAITPISLNPEELTLLDPACGSGHILVEAYDLFKAIYQERGYRAKDIPALILQKNLFGLEIDDRAAQLAAFALMMKARADDRNLFTPRHLAGEGMGVRGIQPNIVAIQESHSLNAEDITHALNSPINKEDMPKEYLFEEIQEEKDGLFSKKALAEKGHVSQGDIASLLELFENGKTFGSLIQVPPKLAAKLPEIEKRLDDVLTHGDLTYASAQVLKPLLQQARLLAQQYDAVVANPPYMGGNAMPRLLKNYLRDSYHKYRTDTFSAFIERCIGFSYSARNLGLVTPFVWMFLPSYEELRKRVLSQGTITSLIQLEYNAFEPACVPVCSFVITKSSVPEWLGTFIRLTHFKGHQNQSPKTLEAINDPMCEWKYFASAVDMSKVPGQPIAYWISSQTRSLFSVCKPLEAFATPKKGMFTGNNDRFLRCFWEIQGIYWHCDSHESSRLSPLKWYPYQKGGDFRKWYGNRQYVVNFGRDGEELKKSGSYGERSPEYYFKPAITWSDLSSSRNAFRLSSEGFLYDGRGPGAFLKRPEHTELLLGLLNSHVVCEIIALLNPTLSVNIGNIKAIPIVRMNDEAECRIREVVHECVEIARLDWDSFETSWDFQTLPILQQRTVTLQDSQNAANVVSNERFSRMKQLELENNRIFIEAYCLQDELSPEVPDDQITLYRPDREEDIKRLLSYAIGCMMGRYSLDKPGLIYANSGNQGFDTNQYRTFRADEDGIIPLFDTDWGFKDDATNRNVEFISVAWPKEYLEENLKFIAESLGPNNGEQPRDTIRRYLATGFYKHHLQMYKKRPIYWLFSSGKQRAFQCLVYLHRYHEGTLARMRTEYVIPLQGQIAARIEQLEGDKAKATSTSHRKKLQKEQDWLKKQQTELANFEEKLKHAADQKIKLDLDDGVKVNYGKFGDLLGELKSVLGGSEE